MTTYYGSADARDDIVKKVEEVWTSSPHVSVELFRENGPEPNLDKLNEFVAYDIAWMGSEAIHIAERPIDRTYGFINFYFGVKGRKGVRKLLVMSDYVKEQLRSLCLGQVRTRIPAAGKKDTSNGWHFETLMVPFYFDGMPKP